MKLGRIAALGAVLLAPVAGAAESERWGSFELGMGNYRPNIDAQPGLTAPPYEDVFGTGRGWAFRAGFAKAIFTRPGALEVGFRTGYFRDSGEGFQRDVAGNITGVRSAEETTFNVVPTSVTLTYRFDLLADRYNIPLAPYGRIALERYNWWTTDDGGGGEEKGATNGWSWTAGIALQLDFFDPGLARELDRDSGVNHTYLFADVTDSHVDDFGSSKSWDLSDEKLSLGFGLMFVF